MSRVKIQVFHENNAINETKLIRTIWVEKSSEKRITGKQAKQIVSREFPAFIQTYGVLLTKYGKSWRASRTIKSTENCGYHYIWEKLIITEE